MLTQLTNLFNDYHTIEGWCKKEKALKMLEYIDDTTQICVELGVWGGKSLLPVAIKCKGTVYGIDAWDKSASLEGVNDKLNDEWWGNINYNRMYTYTHDLVMKYKCDNVKLLKMKSSESIKLFDNDSIDFLHQDSNHSEEISCMEVELYHSKVKQNGIWIFDDTNWPTTKKAQDLLLTKGYIELYDSGEYKVYKRL